MPIPTGNIMAVAVLGMYIGGMRVFILLYIISAFMRVVLTSVPLYGCISLPFTSDSKRAICSSAVCIASIRDASCAAAGLLFLGFLCRRHFTAGPFRDRIRLDNG